MMNHTQARELLHSAGHDINVASLDPAGLITASRRRSRRRALAVGGAAAAVSLVAVGGLLLGTGLGIGGHDALESTNGDTILPIINTSEENGNSIIEALVGGTLSVSAEGCLVVNGGGAPIDLLWPKDFSVVTRDDGIVVVDDQRGRPVATVGSSFLASGGVIFVKEDLACRAGSEHSDVMVIQADIRPGHDVVPLISTSDWIPGDGYMRALVGGLLRMATDGCLFVQQGDQRIDLLWPKDFSAVRQVDGSVVVQDPAGHTVTAVGSAFSASGGYISVPDDHLACRAGSAQAGVMAVQAEIKREQR